MASHADFGGQLVYVREVARKLGSMGHRADILTRRIRDPEWPEFGDDADSYPGHPNVRIFRIPCGPDHFLPKEELWPYLGEWTEGLIGLYQGEGAWPDLWTGHYADGGLVAAWLAEASGVPFTFTGHSLGAWKLDSLLQDNQAPGSLAELDARYNFGARIQAERTSISRARKIVTNSAAERHEQYAHPAYRDLVGPEDDGRFSVIPPGANFDIFSPEARSPWEEEVLAKIRAVHERDLDPGRRGLPAAIAWSRLDPKKNHLGLVKAFARSAELRRQANLVMITRGLEDPLRNLDGVVDGQRPVIEELIAEIDRADLWGSVAAFSLSGQTALAALYRWGADTGGVFCLPAEYEPFGMTVIEAMAVGLPVVATKNGGPQETTDGGRAGLLADPCDPEDIAAKLLHLLGDRQTWENYAQLGRERALENYSWLRTAECYLNLAQEPSGVGRIGEPAGVPLPEFLWRSAGLPRIEHWETAEGKNYKEPDQTAKERTN
ncbi:MAG: glycosyltransferase [Rubrobacteraceae bacterium]